jgi:hypothetical protein
LDTAAQMKRKERREDIRRPQQEPVPVKPRQFVAPPCTLCQSHRPEGSNYSRIYGTVTHPHGKVRYIRCHFCGNSWTVTQRNSAPTEQSSESGSGPAAEPCI